jgi:hypothetical protein
LCESDKSFGNRKRWSEAWTASKENKELPKESKRRELDLFIIMLVITARQNQLDDSSAVLLVAVASVDVSGRSLPGGD